MNANELADKLEKCCLVSWGECNHEDYDTDIWTKMKSATMLRQQHAEIEALKNAKRFIQNFAEEQHHRACQLEEAQEADNEPVAWMYEKPNGASKLSFVKEKMLWEDMTETPLYTHPVKEQDESFDRTASHMAGEYVSYKAELTDEEIRTIQAICHLKNVGYDNFIMRFARAILRKAQEK